MKKMKKTEGSVEINHLIESYMKVCKERGLTNIPASRFLSHLVRELGFDIDVYSLYPDGCEPSGMKLPEE